MDLNKVMIIGNVTMDPETRTTPQGTQVTNFNVATNLVWTDAQGVKQSKAEFHSIVAWRKLAEICAQYLKKGKKVYIEGRLQTRDWEDQNAVKRYKTEVVADNMIMLDRGGAPSSGDGTFAAGAGLGAGSSQAAHFNRPQAAPEGAGAAPSSPQVEEEEIRVEDIPF